MSEARRGLRRSERTIVAGFVLVAIAMRVAVMLFPIGVLDSDGAIVGLMAFHPLDMPIFYWGQAYGGSLEAVLASVLFAVLPDTSFVLKLVPVGLSLLAALLVWRIGLRTVGERPALWGSLAFLLWPAAFLWWSTKMGTYWAALCCALLSLLLLLWLRAEERWPALLSALFGVSVGMGFWLNTQTLYVVVPAALVTLPEAIRNWRRLPLIALGAIAGAAPWIAFNVRNEFLSLEVPPHPVTTYAERVDVFFDNLLPMALGLQVPFTRRWLPLGPSIAIVAVIGIAAAAVWMWRRSPDARPLAAIVVIYPAVYAISPLSWYRDQPRYLLFLMPPLCLTLGWILLRSPRVPLVAGFAVLAGLVVLDMPSLREMNDRRTPSPYAGDVLVPTEFGDLEGLLHDAGVTHAFADYWVSYRATFEFGEDVVITPFNGTVRHLPYDREVRQDDAPAYIFVEESSVDESFAEGLAAQGIPFERLVRGEFSVIVPGERVLPEQVAASLAG